jgi:hypothetical protein
MNPSMNEDCKLIMNVTDVDGIKHPVYGDDFVHMALTDAFEKLATLEANEAQRIGHDA